MATLPFGALQQVGDVMRLHWPLEMPSSRPRAAFGADRCEARVVGAKFVKHDGPVPFGGFTRGDPCQLELNQPLVVSPAFCLPHNRASLAAVDCFSVTLRPAFCEETSAKKKTSAD